MESVVIFKNFAGNSLLILLFFAAFVFLLITEKDKRLRAVLVYLPATVLVLFFFPIFRKIYVRLMGDGTTYYRMMWMIPMGVIIAYAGVKLCSMFCGKREALFRRIVLAALAAAIILLGKYVYDSPYMSKAENLYHLPQEVIDICDLIAPEEGEERVWAVFPTDLVYFVRQYDTNIQLMYGRDMVEPVWGYYHPIHSIMNHPTTIDIEALLELTREKYCSYIVLPKDKKVSEPPENFGLELMDTVDGYPVYMDPVAIEKIAKLHG